MATFLLEIGTEELPSRFLSSIEQELSKRFSDGLKQSDLAFGNIAVRTTPRRAVVLINELADIQPKREELIMGPPARIAYDSNGQPSKAAEGFAKTNNVAVADLETVKTEKGDYLAVRVQKGGAHSSSVLAALCPSVIAALPFPKRMHWGSGDFGFARPLRWIVALLGESVVRFEVGGVTSGRETFGHREHGYGPFSISNPDEYDEVMVKAGVTPSSDARRSAIIEGGNKQASDIGGSVIWKESLLDEVQGLCEHPVPLLGDIDPKYLDVPREVLLTSMETHQKSFGVQDADGRLLPHFLTVLNITPPDWELVKRGWERVLRARLEDARFFWENDLKSSFDTWLNKLDSVIFLAPLGTMGDKSRRVSALCEWIASNARDVNAPSNEGFVLVQDAIRAGRLSKADLVSEMVGEFDTLQGIMGGIYARKMGEKTAVAAAISEQYLPSGPDSPVPSTDLGAVLSIADKADTLVGCFGLGMIPTGTADQYALRRAALGIVRIMLERGILLDVRALFAFARTLYGERKWKLDSDSAQEKLMEFFVARVKNLFLTQGHDTLFVEAVTASGAEYVWSTERRLVALEKLGASENFPKIAQTFKRIANIIRKQAASENLDGTIDASLLQNDAEKELAARIADMSLVCDSKKASESFETTLNAVAALCPFIDAFFEQTMVMCEDASLRKNRLNMLKAVAMRVDTVADFSALQM